MTDQTSSSKPVQNQAKAAANTGVQMPVYGFGLIGAWIYYFSHAATFWIGVLGFFKGLAWPLFMVLELMKYLKM